MHNTSPNTIYAFDTIVECIEEIAWATLTLSHGSIKLRIILSWNLEGKVKLTTGEFNDIKFFTNFQKWKIMNKFPSPTFLHQLQNHSQLKKHLKILVRTFKNNYLFLPKLVRTALQNNNLYSHKKFGNFSKKLWTFVSSKHIFFLHSQAFIG